MKIKEITYINRRGIEYIKDLSGSYCKIHFFFVFLPHYAKTA